jgi:uncharacterized protein
MVLPMRRFIPPQRDPRRTLIIFMIAVTLMLVIQFFVWQPQKPQPPEATSEIQRNSEIHDFVTAKNIFDSIQPPAGLETEFIPQPEVIPTKIPEGEVPKPPAQQPAQAWKEFSIPAHVPNTKAKVVIIIDDMGMDRKHSKEVIELPVPLTLAFLPYAPLLPEITTEARQKGHELIIHTPMEPLDSSLNPGPMVLRSDMSESQLRDMMDLIFDSFGGYVGINNHMGSKLTRDKKAMDIVMEMLVDRGLIFVDSKTIGNSVAAASAAEYGLDYAERDVFLDHVNTIEAVTQSIEELEKVARRRGYAIAIGHPRPETIRALKSWLTVAEQRGFTVVPVSAVVKHKRIEEGVKTEVSYPPMPGAAYGPSQPRLPPP